MHSSTKPVTAEYSSVVAASSVPAILRVSTLASAQDIEEASTNSAAGWNAPVPGRTITSTPSSPTRMASHRRMPTTSPSTGTDSAVISSGETKPTEAASASGMDFSASMKNSAEPTSPTPRATCSHGLRTASRRRPRRSTRPPAITTKVR